MKRFLSSFITLAIVMSQLIGVNAAGLSLGETHSNAFYEVWNEKTAVERANMLDNLSIVLGQYSDGSSQKAFVEDLFNTLDKYKFLDDKSGLRTDVTNYFVNLTDANNKAKFIEAFDVSSDLDEAGFGLVAKKIADTTTITEGQAKCLPFIFGFVSVLDSAAVPMLSRSAVDNSIVLSGSMSAICDAIKITTDIDLAEVDVKNLIEKFVGYLNAQSGDNAKDFISNIGAESIVKNDGEVAISDFYSKYNARSAEDNKATFQAIGNIMISDIFLQFFNKYEQEVIDNGYSEKTVVAGYTVKEIIEVLKKIKDSDKKSQIIDDIIALGELNEEKLMGLIDKYQKDALLVEKEALIIKDKILPLVNVLSSLNKFIIDENADYSFTLNPEFKQYMDKVGETLSISAVKKLLDKVVSFLNDLSTSSAPSLDRLNLRQAGIDFGFVKPYDGATLKAEWDASKVDIKTMMEGLVIKFNNDVIIKSDKPIKVLVNGEENATYGEYKLVDEKADNEICIKFVLPKEKAKYTIQFIDGQVLDMFANKPTEDISFTSGPNIVGTKFTSFKKKNVAYLIRAKKNFVKATVKVQNEKIKLYYMVKVKGKWVKLKTKCKTVRKAKYYAKNLSWNGRVKGKLIPYKKSLYNMKIVSVLNGQNTKVKSFKLRVLKPSKIMIKSALIYGRKSVKFGVKPSRKTITEVYIANKKGKAVKMIKKQSLVKPKLAVYKWNVKNAKGKKVGPGKYYIVIKSGGKTYKKRIKIISPNAGKNDKK